MFPFLRITHRKVNLVSFVYKIICFVSILFASPFSRKKGFVEINQQIQISESYFGHSHQKCIINFVRRPSYVKRPPGYIIILLVFGEASSMKVLYMENPYMYDAIKAFVVKDNQICLSLALPCLLMRHFWCFVVEIFLSVCFFCMYISRFIN